MRPARLIRVVAAAGALSLAACGSNDPGDGEAAEPDPPPGSTAPPATVGPSVLRPATGDVGGPAAVAGLVTVPDGFLIIGERILPDGTTTTAFWRSGDGESWTLTDAEPAVWEGWTVDRAAQGPAGIVVLAGGDQGRGLATSVDGVTWTMVPITAESIGLPAGTFAGAFPINDVAAVDDGFLALGQSIVNDATGTRHEPLLLVSSDGATWQRASGPALGPTDVLPEYFAGAAMLDGTAYVLVTATQGADAWLWRSTDATTWDLVGRTELFAPAGSVVSALSSHAGRLVAAGHDPASSAATAWTSIDGSTWTPEAAADLIGPPSYAGWLLAPADDELLMIGTAQAGDGARTGVVWASIDGEAWLRGPDGPEVGGTTFIDAASRGSHVAVVGWHVAAGTDLTALQMDAWWVERPGSD